MPILGGGGDLFFRRELSVPSRLVTVFFILIVDVVPQVPALLGNVAHLFLAHVLWWHPDHGAVLVPGRVVVDVSFAHLVVVLCPDIRFLCCILLLY
jgi:hypothetical protein